MAKLKGKIGKVVSPPSRKSSSPSRGTVRSTSSVTTNKKKGGDTRTSDNSKGQHGGTFENYLEGYFRGIDRMDLSQSNEFLSGQMWNAEAILNTEGITLSRLRSKLLNVGNININKAPSQVDFTNYGKMFAFFTKPDLNLFRDNSLELNQTIIDNCPDLAQLIRRNIPVARSLQQSFGAKGSYGPSGGFVNILGNLCNEINTPDVNLSVQAAPRNQKGFGISYGGDFWESLQEGDVEISFIDTRDADVATMMQIWTMYIEGVRNGNIFKKWDYIMNNIIDYACSIFIFAVDESMNIIAHTMLIGCFPRSLNNQLTQYKATMLSANDFIGPFNYNWHISMLTKPNLDSTIRAFNFCSGYSEKVAKHVPNTGYEGVQDWMHTQKGGYWFHNGITLDVGIHASYPYKYALEDKWAEMAGVGMNTLSSGAVMYTLAFMSKFAKAKQTKITDLYLGTQHSINSRWRDGKYMRKLYKNGQWVWHEVTKDDLGGGLWGATASNTTRRIANYGYLNNLKTFGPIVGAYGVHGEYQSGWENWNQGSGRMGRNFGIASKNNAKSFRNLLRNLF